MGSLVGLSAVVLLLLVLWLGGVAVYARRVIGIFPGLGLLICLALGLAGAAIGRSIPIPGDALED